MWILGITISYRHIHNICLFRFHLAFALPYPLNRHTSLYTWCIPFKYIGIYYWYMCLFFIHSVVSFSLIRIQCYILSIYCIHTVWGVWWLLASVACRMITNTTCFILPCILWFLLCLYLYVNMFIWVYIYSVHLFMY